MDASVTALKALIDDAANGPLDLSGRATSYNAVEAALLEKERSLQKCPQVRSCGISHKLALFCLLCI